MDYPMEFYIVAIANRLHQLENINKIEVLSNGLSNGILLSLLPMDQISWKMLKKKKEKKSLLPT